MNMIVVLVILALVGAIIIVNTVGVEKPDKRAVFLEKFAKMVEAQFEPIDGYDNALRVRFVYEGQPFVYEDYEEEGFQKSTFKGYLKYDTGKTFTLTFSEKQGVSIRADVQTIGDVATPWARGSELVRLPKSLADFRATSNRPDVATRLLADAAVVKQFEKYKNVDSRGFHLMPLEISSGVLSLCFYPRPDIKPSLFKLRRDVASLTEHLKTLRQLAQKVAELKDIDG